MTDFDRLVPGRVIDVKTVASRASRLSLDARVNGILERFGAWRVGTEGGRPAVFNIDSGRGVVLWPWRRNR